MVFKALHGLAPHILADDCQLTTYIGSLIHCTGDSAPEIKRRVSITRDCMMALDRNIWRSRISLGTKLRLYITHAFCQSFYMVRRRGRDSNGCEEPVIRRAATFWTACNRRIKQSAIPNMRQLQ